MTKKYKASYAAARVRILLSNPTTRKFPKSRSGKKRKVSVGYPGSTLINDKKVYRPWIFKGSFAEFGIRVHVVGQDVPFALVNNANRGGHILTTWCEGRPGWIDTIFLLDFPIQGNFVNGPNLTLKWQSTNGLSDVNEYARVACLFDSMFVNSFMKINFSVETRFLNENFISIRFCKMHLQNNISHTRWINDVIKPIHQSMVTFFIFIFLFICQYFHDAAQNIFQLDENVKILINLIWIYTYSYALLNAVS